MTLRYIKNQVERETGISGIDKKGRQRDKVIARAIYANLAYQFTSCPLIDIGKEINRDHATVIHYLNTLESHLLHEPVFSKVHQVLNIRFTMTHKDQLTKEKVINYIQGFPSDRLSELLKKLEEIEI